MISAKVSGVPSFHPRERSTDHHSAGPGIIDWFRSKVEEQGGGNYQTMLNDALRKYVERQEQPLEEVIRRVVREELHAAQ